MSRISFKDIKWDLLKIIEPWNGILEEKNPSPIKKLFSAYLTDLQKKKLIHDYSIDVSDRIVQNKKTAFTYDVNIQVIQNRNPKTLKIHVDTYNHPWVQKS